MNTCLFTYISNCMRSDKDVEEWSHKHTWKYGHQWSPHHQILSLRSDDCAEGEAGKYDTGVHQCRHDDWGLYIPNSFNQRSGWQSYIGRNRAKNYNMRDILPVVILVIMQSILFTCAKSKSIQIHESRSIILTIGTSGECQHAHQNDRSDCAEQSTL